MAEAFGLAANIVSIIHITSEVTKRLNDFKKTADGVPRALQVISNELPTLSYTLKKIHTADEEGRISEDSREALEPLLTDLEAQITALAGIIDKLRPKDSSKMARNLKVAKSFLYDDDVKFCEKAIRGYISTLSLERIVSGPGKDVAALHRPLVPRFVCPFGQDADFVERTILAELIAKTGPGTRHALVGGGGMGKSQLAITYGHRLHQTHPNTWIFWIDAETTTKFEQGFRVIANELRIKGRNDKDADILNLVYEYLHNTNNGRWILILDNADDKNVFTSAPSAYYQARSDKQLRDFLPQSANGSILVTSRSRDAAYYVTCNYKHIFSVEQMTEDEAMALLRSQLDATHHEDEMKTLLKVLCYVPLAVTQAAAYISRRSLPIPDYLRELKRGNRLSTSLLEESSPQLRRDSGRSNSIIATWRVTFEYVRRNAPSAARLLSLMCLFDNQNIPEALLQGQYGEEVSAPLSNTAKEWWRRRRLHKRWRYRGAHVVKSLPCDFEDDWLMLRDYSLIKVNKDRKHFSMHPMVQFTTEKWLISRKQLDVWSPRFILIMNRNFPDSFAFASTTKDCERLFAHACAAVSYRPPSTASQSLQDWAAITYKVAGHYSTQDALEIAEKLYHVAAVGFEAALGTCTPQAMECYAQRSSRLCTLGRKPESEAIQRRVLGLQTRFLGEDHHETLETMTVLGEILASSRQESGAEELHVKVLNSRLRVLGPSHEKTQLSFQICGSHYFVHGRYEEAYTIYRQAHEGKRHDAQEKCDWEWAGKLRGMSTSLVLSGKAKDAEFHVREAISEIGKDPPGLELMKTHTQLARILAGQGDHAGAEKHFETALQWYDAQASSHHTERIEVLRDLSMALCQLGRLDAAVDMARRCLAEGKEMYGPEHYETFAYTWILAGILEKHGDFDEALQLFRKASDGAKELLGEGHVDTTEFEADYTRLARSMAKAALGNVVEDEDTKPASER